MNWLWVALVGAIAVLAFFAWGFVRIIRRTADAADLLKKVQEEDIPALAEECIRVCDERLGTKLSFDNFEHTVEALDYVLEPDQRTHMKLAFETSGHAGRFVLPLGAYIGEFVRAHNPSARWIPRQGGGLAMEVPQGSSTLTMHPFDKVLKHAATGHTGEIRAYIEIAAARSGV